MHGDTKLLTSLQPENTETNFREQGPAPPPEVYTQPLNFLPLVPPLKGSATLYCYSKLRTQLLTHEPGKHIFIP